jgi:hypothetical protein
LGIVTAVNLTTLLLGAALGLFVGGTLNEAQKFTLEMCKYGLMTTLGALVGLLCGRLAGPDALVDVDDDDNAGRALLGVGKGRIERAKAARRRNANLPATREGR